MNIFEQAGQEGASIRARAERLGIYGTGPATGATDQTAFSDANFTLGLLEKYKGHLDKQEAKLEKQLQHAPRQQQL